MAHNLFQNSMAFVGEAPWHGLGTRVPPSVSAAEMIKAAKLDWVVSKEPAPGARFLKERDSYDRYLLYRGKVGDEEEKVALGMVGRDYTPLQNEEAFAFFEPLIANGWANFHTAGALGDGERVWVLTRLKNQIIINGDDVVDRFVLLSNTHDGSGAVSIRFTPIRVVCQNTLNYAMKKSSGVLSVRHTKNVQGNLAKAQAEKLQQVITKVFEDAETLFGQMVLRGMKAQSVDKFLDLLFPRTEKQRKEDKQPERWSRIKYIIDDPKITPTKTKSTLWALYNAIIRDEDYRVSRENDSQRRLYRVWFGDGHDLKKKTLYAARKYLRMAA